MWHQHHPLRPYQHPLAFGNQDLLDGKPNKHVALLIRAVVANVEVRRILVDQGNSTDIIFVDLLRRIKFFEDKPISYRGTKLSGLNSFRTKPLGYMDLMVTYGEEPLVRTVKTKFLVLPCSSVYHCIIERPTLGRLGAVTSTTHLEMKFYSLCSKVITINTDNESAQRCWYLHMKEDSKATEEGDPPVESKAKGRKKGEGRAVEVNVADVDAQYNPDGA